MSYETIEFEVGDDHVATVTLNRPDKLNAFNQTMCDEFTDVWTRVRHDDAIHTVLLRANGERAFCTGVDVRERLAYNENIWNRDDPGEQLGPKANRVWKPLIVACHAMVAGGAFYWLNEADIVICSDDAMFFDPHVSYGMTSALEPIGFRHKVNLGDVLRWALMGLDERMSADRALQIGLATEVTSREELWKRGHQIAAQIAAKPATAVQGTVRAIWESLDIGRRAALDRGMSYPVLGNPIGTAEVDRDTFERPKWTLR